MSYRGSTAIVVVGEVSGTPYLFGPAGTFLEVDARDEASLLASGWYQRG